MDMHYAPRNPWVISRFYVCVSITWFPLHRNCIVKKLEGTSGSWESVWRHREPSASSDLRSEGQMMTGEPPDLPASNMGNANKANNMAFFQICDKESCCWHGINSYQCNSGVLFFWGGGRVVFYKLKLLMTVYPNVNCYLSTILCEILSTLLLYGIFHPKSPKYFTNQRTNSWITPLWNREVLSS